VRKPAAIYTKCLSRWLRTQTVYQPKCYI